MVRPLFALLPILAIAAAVLAGGCFSERSFPMRPRDMRRVPPVGPAGGSATAGAATRAWLVRTERRLAPLLPRGDAPLLTDDLVGPDGAPIDVYAHFGLRPEKLGRLLGNLSGLLDTAQASGGDPVIDPPAPAWPGFNEVWIPIDAGLSLSGRLGLARRDGRVIDADCIVLLSGLLGDVGIDRIKQLALALNQAGFHALALEQRGAGQTERRHPGVAYTFAGPTTRSRRPAMSRRSSPGPATRTSPRWCCPAAATSASPRMRGRGFTAS